MSGKGEQVRRGTPTRGPEEKGGQATEERTALSGAYDSLAATKTGSLDGGRPLQHASTSGLPQDEAFNMYISATSGTKDSAPSFVALSVLHKFSLRDMMS